MKANKRIRDLSRRSKTDVRRFLKQRGPRVYVTTNLWWKKENGGRERNPFVDFA